VQNAFRNYVKCEVNLRARQAQRAYDELEVVWGDRKRIAGRRLRTEEAQRQVMQAKQVVLKGAR